MRLLHVFIDFLAGRLHLRGQGVGDLLADGVGGVLLVGEVHAGAVFGGGGGHLAVDLGHLVGEELLDFVQLLLAGFLQLLLQERIPFFVGDVHLDADFHRHGGEVKHLEFATDILGKIETPDINAHEYLQKTRRGITGTVG